MFSNCGFLDLSANSTVLPPFAYNYVLIYLTFAVFLLSPVQIFPAAYCLVEVCVSAATAVDLHCTYSACASLEPILFMEFGSTSKRILWK
jgi:hypothetical protein